MLGSGEFLDPKPDKSVYQPENWKKLSEAQKWRYLTRHDKVALYYPGVTLEPKEKKNITYPSRTHVGLFGRRGFGKSSFLESCLHIFKGLQFPEFYRQGPSDESFTVKRDVAEISRALSLVDFPGLLNLGDDWIRSVLAEVENIKNRKDVPHSNFDQPEPAGPGAVSRQRIKLQAALVFWDSEADDYERLMPLLDALHNLMGERPLVILTKIDKVPPETWQNMQKAMEQYFNCPVFAVANYTYHSTEENPRMNAIFCEVLAQAVLRADKFVVHWQKTHKQVCEFQ
mmetsp:Transcript_15661/g.27069  ORF Transcript_15661/g.27069 Transcript_15661/m.27069 type:complete len:285 (-) Transcript_15661:312-1166(-)